LLLPKRVEGGIGFLVVFFLLDSLKLEMAWKRRWRWRWRGGESRRRRSRSRREKKGRHLGGFFFLDDGGVMSGGRGRGRGRKGAGGLRGLGDLDGCGDKERSHLCRLFFFNDGGVRRSGGRLRWTRRIGHGVGWLGWRDRGKLPDRRRTRWEG
jgi:hypothetical protein